MRASRAELVATLWNGLDPFDGFPPHLYEVDLQGWGSNHRYLTQAVAEIRPTIIVEVGVWKGASTATMAKKLKELQIEGVVVAIDTWLGSSEHWTTPQWFSSLSIEHGRPALQKKFMANMLAGGIRDYVLPLPIDSLNAAKVLKELDLGVDLLHLDGGHDYASVIADLRAWWPLLRPGGILIGDDYNTNGAWPGVRQAFDEYFGEVGLTPFEAAPPKCLIRKPTDARRYQLFEPSRLSESPWRRAILGAPTTGDEEHWQEGNRTGLQQYRWMATDSVCWQIEILGTPASLQVKIPFACESQPGTAAQSAVLINGTKADIQVRESAIFARSPHKQSGRVNVELQTSEVVKSSALQGVRRLGITVVS